jgi:hypothetical protein
MGLTLVAVGITFIYIVGGVMLGILLAILALLISRIPAKLREDLEAQSAEKLGKEDGKYLIKGTSCRVARNLRRWKLIRYFKGSTGKVTFAPTHDIRFIYKDVVSSPGSSSSETATLVDCSEKPYTGLR